MSVSQMCGQLQEEGWPIEEQDDGSWCVGFTSEISDISYAVLFSKGTKGRGDTDAMVILPSLQIPPLNVRDICRELTSTKEGLGLRFNYRTKQFTVESSFDSDDFWPAMSALIIACDGLAQLLLHASKEGKQPNREQLKFAFELPKGIA